MLEGRRAVLFEEEVTHPGEAVAGDGHREQQADGAFAQGIRQKPNHQRGADKVQASAGAVAMFLQVVRVKLGEAIESLDVSTVAGPLIVMPSNSCSAGSLFESRVISGNSQ